MTQAKHARRPRPICHLIAVAVAAMSVGQTAMAEPDHAALRRLLPLEEIYAKGQTPPPYDVAGLRCAGLYLAQFNWATEHPGVTGPDAARMAVVDLLLEASEQQRLNDGMALARAHVSIEREAKRVLRLYRQRFAANSDGGGHPWSEDPLVAGDSRFCEALIRGL